MATAAHTSTTRILPPPSERGGVLGWLRKNLFGSLFDTILTLLALGFLYLVLRPLVTWIVSADWSVIPANFTLILRGPYPEEAVERLWLCLYLLFGLVGDDRGVGAASGIGTDSLPGDLQYDEPGGG
jgi:general L-amino acid transport system permease protein